MKDSLPLKCHLKKDRIVIEIGLKTLKVAAAQHPEFWDGESGSNVPNIDVIDIKQFAKDVVTALNDENEIGETLVTNMLDHGMRIAVENGSEGVNFE